MENSTFLLRTTHYWGRMVDRIHFRPPGEMLVAIRQSRNCVWRGGRDTKSGSRASEAVIVICIRQASARSGWQLSIVNIWSPYSVLRTPYPVPVPLRMLQPRPTPAKLVLFLLLFLLPAPRNATPQQVRQYVLRTRHSVLSTVNGNIGVFPSSINSNSTPLRTPGEQRYTIVSLTRRVFGKAYHGHGGI